MAAISLLIERMERQGITGIAAGRFLKRAKILFAAARDAVESFDFVVVWLEVGISDRPIPDRSRNALAVISSRLKILLAGPDERPAIKACSPAEDAPHVEPPGRAVDVDLAVVVRPFIDQRRLFVVRRTRSRGHLVPRSSTRTDLPARAQA